MPIEMTGVLDGHTVTLDAQTAWPRVLIACTCGWESEVNAEEEHSIKDAIARTWIHLGGPKQIQGDEGPVHVFDPTSHLDRNTLNQRLDDLLGT